MYPQILEMEFLLGVGHILDYHIYQFQIFKFCMVWTVYRLLQVPTVLLKQLMIHLIEATALH
jgi:hypothetical protein